MAVDLNTVLPHPEQRRGRPLEAEERRLAEALSDLITLSPPAGQLGVALSGDILGLQTHQHLADSQAPALRAPERLGEGDGGLASTAEHTGEPGCEAEGELGGEETNLSSVT